MDALAAEALGNLTDALTALLPGGGTPPGLLVLPQRVTRPGLGGYVGLHHDPAGEVLGRRVAAKVVVSVSAPNVSGVESGVRDVVNALMTQGHDELARLGILRLALLELGPRPVAATTGPSVPLVREVAFDVLYEFLKLPAPGGGIIETIPLDLDVSLAANQPRVLTRGGFQAASLTAFEAVDDPQATTAAPGAWSFDAADAALVQGAAIRGGPNTSAPAKPGSYLTLRPTPAVPVVRDLSLAASVRADEGGIGFVFRFIDVDHFYYVLLDSRTGFRRFGKKVAGTFAGLQEGGLDTATGFVAGALMRLRLVAREDSFQLRLDGEPILEGFDGELVEPGRVGFMTRHCAGARCFDLTLLRL